MKSGKFILMLFFAAILAVSCSKYNPNEPNPNPDPIIPEVTTGQSISGEISVYNRNLHLGIGNNVVVELHKNGKKVKSTTSDKNGKYLLSNVPEGTYTIVMAKKGYYNAPVQKVYQQYSLYTVKKDTPVTVNLKLYKKATASIESIVWRQGNPAKGDDSKGIVLDIKFKDLNMAEVDEYVYVYFFAGYNDQISKANCKEYIDRADGSGWAPGYGKAWIRKKAIVNNEVKGYWDSRICAWIGGSLKSAKCPSHMAIYVTNSLPGAVDGLFGGDYVTVGENYSGISENRFLRRS